MHPENTDITKLHQILGAKTIDDGRTNFCVWAPDHARVEIEMVDQGRRIEMTKANSGYHFATVGDIMPGDRYAYRLSGGPLRPDPVSRFQPDGVHGPSQVIDPRFAWTDDDWKTPPIDDLIIYEAHVGAFTESGTFLSAIDRLDELVELGVTAIEWMPVAQCPGRWNWGYDGVNLFAPNHNYGTPDDMRRFVDAAHAKGLAVILDVVYNHLGPEGNYLGDFGPYFSSKHDTPWGAAPNLDDPETAQEARRFIIANAVYWLDEFHLDGLRVDAVHCIGDDSETHVAAEITDAVRTWSRHSGRNALLIAESNVYDPEMIRPRDLGGIGFDAQWCDDLLHSVSAVVRPGDQLCHRVYRPGHDLDQTLRMGFVYEGTLGNQRGRLPLGPRVDTRGLVYSIQQHDFIGNHPQGKRFHQLTSVDAQKAAATLLILSPGIPMMFMGEEFACENPFRFFVDFGDPELRTAVAEGRMREYPQHDWDTGLLPNDPHTFRESKIGPRECGDADLWDWYRSLILLRKRLCAQSILSDENATVCTDLALGVYTVRYESSTGSVDVVVRLNPVNVGTSPVPNPSGPCTLDVKGDVVLDSNSNDGESDQWLINQAKVIVRPDSTALADLLKG
tara:strand:+ start:760352 stop:762202 length:1851 start_codon:yes stop_codon:yes gene_type:complete